MDFWTNITTFHGSVAANVLSGLISGGVFFILGLFTGKTVERKKIAKIDNRRGFMMGNRINSDDNK